MLVYSIYVSRVNRFGSNSSSFFRNTTKEFFSFPVIIIFFYLHPADRRSSSRSPVAYTRR